MDQITTVIHTMVLYMKLIYIKSNEGKKDQALINPRISTEDVNVQALGSCLCEWVVHTFIHNIQKLVTMPLLLSSFDLVERFLSRSL